MARKVQIGLVMDQGVYGEALVAAAEHNMSFADWLLRGIALVHVAHEKVTRGGHHLGIVDDSSRLDTELIVFR